MQVNLEKISSETDFRDIYAYSNHNIAVSQSGCVFTWGNSGSGRLGHGDLNRRTMAFELQKLTPPGVSDQRLKVNRC